MKPGLSMEELRALAARRFAAVGSGDIEATMALLVDEPVFDLHPVGLRLEGQSAVRLYYARFFAVCHGTLSAEPLATYFADDAIVCELALTHQPPSGPREPYQLLAIMETEAGRFKGERLYGDERLFRIMFGDPIWPLLTPIASQ